ncbi:MAG: TylF/MycF/NovP-related O-methyltransferase [Rhodospirillaceae bacterium]
MLYPEEFVALWQTVSPHTMTSDNRGYGLYSAVCHVLDHGIPGDFVESGVWRGGSAMLIAALLAKRGVTDRALYLFDTFDGMTAPSSRDKDLFGNPAAQLMAISDADDGVHARCDLATVQSNLASTGFDPRHIHYIAGDVRQTLSHAPIQHIALLRLDTDFYDSTVAELTHLYPLLVPGGILIIDDYGHWQGSKAAVDDFLAAEKTMGRTHFLTPLDYTGRLLVKP